MGGERLEAEGPQQERGRQFLHAIHEHQQCRRGDRRTHQRQVNPPQPLPRRLPHGPRRIIQRRGDPAEAGFDAARRHRQEANDVGVDQRGARPEQEESGRDAQHTGGGGVDQPIHAGDHRQQADGQDRTGHGVAERRHAREGGRPPASVKAYRIHDEHTARDRQRRRDQRHRHGTQHLGDDSRREAGELQAGDGRVHEIRQGDHEADGHGDGAGGQGGDAGPSAEPVRRQGPRLLRVVRVAPVPPRAALEDNEAHDDGEHRQGDLGGARQVGARDPGRVDRDGERAHAEELGGADVVERLHHREACPDGNRRTRKRERHAPEQGATAHAERARHVHQVRRLHQEHRARRQVDIRVEHEAEQDDAARHRADVGQPELTRAVVAEQRAQRRLERPDWMQDVEIRVGDDVGGNGEGQEERPVEHPAAGEVVRGDEPGRRGAERDGEHADAGEQHHRRADGVRQHVCKKVLPVCRVAARRREGQRRDGREHRDGHGGGAGEPPVGRRQAPCGEHHAKCIN